MIMAALSERWRYIYLYICFIYVFMYMASLTYDNGKPIRGTDGIYFCMPVLLICMEQYGSIV
jgi:hypothetical protein